MTSPPSGSALHVEAEVPAPAPRVFELLIDPHRLAEWWGPHGFRTPDIEMDLRVGGRYRFAMQPPDGALFHLQGEFLEIDPPRRLVSTFRWEQPDPDDVETVVDLSLVDLGGATRLIVDQGPFATQPRRALHTQGWTESLARLYALIRSTNPA